MRELFCLGQQEWHDKKETSGVMFFIDELNANRRLTGLKIASKYVASLLQCMQECLQINIQKCQSINFEKKESNNGHLCEFNAAIDPKEVTMFVDDPRFAHYQLP